MNGIYTFCGVAVCLACFSAVIKQLKADYLPIYTAACSVVCGAYLVSLVSPVIKYVTSLMENALLPQFFALLLKSVGVAVLCGVAADVCRACGENAIASGVEGAGKVVIVLISLPVVSYLLEAALQLAA